MESIQYSVNIVIPVVLLIVLGYALKQAKMMDDRFIGMGSKLAFTFAIPVNLFNGIYVSGMGEKWDYALLIFCILAVLASAALLIAVVPRFVKDGPRAASMVQGMYRSNFVLIGTPLVADAFGAAAAPLVSLVMPFAITLFNICAVLIFTTLAPAAGKKLSVKGQLLAIAKNPLVIACVLSIAVSVSGLRFPKMVDKTLSYVGNMAVPLSLLLLGGQIDLKAGLLQGKLSLVASLVRCGLVPLVSVLLAALLGFRGARLMVVFVLMAAPASVSSFVMSREMGGDAQLSADIVALSTVLSAFTLTAGIALMKGLNWL